MTGIRSRPGSSGAPTVVTFGVLGNAALAERVPRGKDRFPVADPSFTFGPFRLVPAQRALLQDGKPLRLGSRSLELLLVLVQRAGEVVANEELIAQVWPNLHVEEGSLRVHVSALRRILGDGRAGLRYITNVPGRGYSFVAPVSRDDARPATPEATDEQADSQAPVSLTSVIGRADIISTLIAQLRKRRF